MERDGTTEGRDATRARPPSLVQAARPKKMLVGQTVRNTDLQRASEASTQRRWPRGHILRPASLGEATQPHSAVSGVALSREV